MSVGIHKSPSEVTIEDWMKLFPRQLTNSYTNSLTFVKRVIVIAVSTITYLKKIFPKENYTFENFGGLTLAIFKDKCKDDLARLANTTLLHCFDALEKRYMRWLVMCLFVDGPEHPGNLVEMYVFKFSYKQEGVSVAMHTSNNKGGAHGSTHETRYSFNDICKETLNLLRTCVATAQNNPTPSDNYDIRFNIYFNDDIPAEYQGPSFNVVSVSEGNDPVLQMLEDFCEFDSRAVKTPYHDLVLSSHLRYESADDVTIIPSFNDHELFGLRELVVLCECGKEDNNGPTLRCNHCNYLQHAPCFGIAGNSPLPTVHCCTKCYDTFPGRTTNFPNFSEYSDKNKRMSVCIYRRALAWLADEKQEISEHTMARWCSISQRSAVKLINNLHKNNILNEVEGSYTIDHKQLDAAMKFYFLLSNNNTVVDRLVAESHTRSETPDPVGKALLPNEHMSLVSAAAVGTAVHRTQPESVEHDSTLQLYKEAFVDDRANDDLPLSNSQKRAKLTTQSGHDNDAKKKKVEPKRTFFKLKAKRTKDAA